MWKWQKKLRKKVNLSHILSWHEFSILLFWSLQYSIHNGKYSYLEHSLRLFRAKDLLCECPKRLLPSERTKKWLVIVSVQGVWNVLVRVEVVCIDDAELFVKLKVWQCCVVVDGVGVRGRVVVGVGDDIVSVVDGLRRKKTICIAVDVVVDGVVVDGVNAVDYLFELSQC